MSDHPSDSGNGSDEMFGDLPAKPTAITVRSVDWRSLIPWTLIFRTVPLASGVSVVLLGSVGVLLAWLGWYLGGLVFGVNDERLEQLPHLASIKAQHQSVTAPAVDLPTSRQLTDLPTVGVSNVVFYYWEPAVGVLRVPAEKGLVSFAYLSWGLLWSIAVWSWIGGAIARIAVVRLGKDESVGLKEAIVYSSRRFLSFFAPPLYPLALLLVLALLGLIPGLLMRLELGAAIVSLVWFIGLLVSMVFAVVIIGALIGWPLMVVTTAAEGTDSLDGLARGFAYSFQRPINYVLYLLISLVFSVLCIFIASLIANLVLDLTYWSVSWGTGGERLAELRPSMVLDGGPVVTDEENSTLKFSQSMFRFWDGLLGILLNGFAFGLFWCLFSAIYLLLRRDVDETEVDEIFVEDDDWQDLPDLSQATLPMNGNAEESEQKKDDEKPAESEASDHQEENEPAGESSGQKPAEDGDGGDDVEPDEPVKDEG